MGGHFLASIHFLKWWNSNSIGLILGPFPQLSLMHQAGIYHAQHEAMAGIT